MHGMHLSIYRPKGIISTGFVPVYKWCLNGWAFLLFPWWIPVVLLYTKMDNGLFLKSTQGNKNLQQQQKKNNSKIGIFLLILVWTTHLKSLGSMQTSRKMQCHAHGIIKILVYISTCTSIFCVICPTLDWKAPATRKIIITNTLSDIFFVIIPRFRHEERTELRVMFITQTREDVLFSEIEKEQKMEARFQGHWKLKPVGTGAWCKKGEGDSCSRNSRSCNLEWKAAVK